jgi:hypothetical protein
MSQAPDCTLKPPINDHPAGRLVALIPFPTFAPKLLTGTPSNVTMTLISADAVMFVLLPPAVALLAPVDLHLDEKLPTR